MRMIIWGHKPSSGRNFFGRRKVSHTHSYIHLGYYKAFLHLGYETFWFDNSDDVRNFDFSDCLFFTEAQVDQKIPLIKGCIYVLHHCDISKYLLGGCKILNLCNYVADCENGVSFNYEGCNVEKVGELQFYDKVSRAFYQPWATDLLPQEIDLSNVSIFDSQKKSVNYVGGTGHDNISQRMSLFAEAAKAKKKKLNIYSNISSDIAVSYIRDSYLSVDLRGDWHLLRGYIPCRIFKSISYGKYIGTNSNHVYNVFRDMIAFNSNPYDLFATCEEEYSKLKIQKFQDTMKFVRDNHTYVNRVTNLLNMINAM